MPGPRSVVNSTDSEHLPILNKDDKTQELSDISQPATRATSTVVADSGDDTFPANTGGSRRNTWIDPNPPPYKINRESIPDYPALSPTYQDKPSKGRRESATIIQQPIIIQQKSLSNASIADEKTTTEKLKTEPGLIKCIHCNKIILSQVKFEIGSTAIMLSFILCCTPLCFNKWKDAHHICPNCKTVIAIVKPCDD